MGNLKDKIFFKNPLARLLFTFRNLFPFLNCICVYFSFIFLPTFFFYLLRLLNAKLKTNLFTSGFSLNGHIPQKVFVIV